MGDRARMVMLEDGQAGNTDSVTHTIGRPLFSIETLPEDLIIDIVNLLPIPGRFASAGACRRWRDIILNTSSLWTQLDLRYAGNEAVYILVELLLLSGDAPLDLAFRFVGGSSGAVDHIATSLAPHLHRIRALSVHSRFMATYTLLFELLRRPTPLLRTLDVSHDPLEYLAYKSEAIVPVDFLSAAPQLYHVNWGAHRLPSALNCLAAVRSLRISTIGDSSERIFSLFPHLHTLCLDGFDSFRGVQKLPEDHPLQYLELRVSPIQNMPYHLAWESMRAHGFARVSVLSLHYHSQTVLFGACRDDEWQLRTLTVDYDDFVDAILISDARECRMTSMAPMRSNSWSVGKIMREPGWLCALASLTLSLALSVNQVRPSLLLPRGCLPELRTFSILCGAPVPNKYRHALEDSLGTLLDEAILADCGLLEAPKLEALLLISRPPHPERKAVESLRVISPSELALFISGHVKVSSDCVRVLVVDEPGVRLANDEVGMVALQALVGKIACKF